MSYPNINPNNPLANSAWRIRHSAWLLAVVFGCGLLSFIGFLYCAIRVRTRKWWTRAAVTGGITAACWVLMELFVESTDGSTTSSSTSTYQGEVGENFAVGALLAAWIGMMIYGFIVNREYLRWRAGYSEANAWYNQPSGTGISDRVAPTTPFVQPPAPGPPLGVDLSTYYAPSPPARNAPRSGPAPATPPPPPPATGVWVDVNGADAATIAGVLGLEAATAARIVSIRDQQRGFQSIDELVAAANLQPHELLRVRGKVAFGAYTPVTPPTSASATDQPAPPSEPRSGRILDY